MNDNIDWHDLLQRLAEPFDASEIKYRAGATNRDKTKAIALAYADPRAYEDRLNLLVPGEWQVQFTPWWVFRRIRPSVPFDSGRLFRGYPATLSG